MTAAERLKLLSGSGLTAGERLRRIGRAGVTASALLVAYSGLPTASAATHLLHDVVRATAFIDAEDESDNAVSLHDRNNQIIMSTLAAIIASGALET